MEILEMLGNDVIVGNSKNKQIEHHTLQPQQSFQAQL
jgi:hypothetical protein